MFENEDNQLYLFPCMVTVKQWFPKWALIGTRGGRERCYYHTAALVDK